MVSTSDQADVGRQVATNRLTHLLDGEPGIGELFGLRALLDPAVGQAEVQNGDVDTGGSEVFANT